MAQLTERQAFAAMVLFLEQCLERTQSDDVAGLLSDMLFLPDGSTADPAAWHDWIAAVQKVLRMDEAEARRRFTWPGDG